MKKYFKRLAIVLSLALVFTTVPTYATETVVPTETTETTTEEEAVEESEEKIIEIVDEITEEPEASEEEEKAEEEVQKEQPEQTLEETPENEEEEKLEETEEDLPMNLIYQEITGEPCKEVIVKGMLPEGVKVHAAKLTYEDVKEYVEDEEDFKGAYDVTLLLNGKEYQPEESVNVEFKEVDDTDNVEVTHVHQEGTDEEEVTTIEVDESENGNAEIEVDGFSLIILTTLIDKYLTFTAEEYGSWVKLSWETSSNVEYATNGNAFATYTEGVQINLSEDEYVKFKGSGIKTNANRHFEMGGKIAASGDVTSLTNGVGGNADLTDDCYKGMFSSCSALTSAPELPSATLANGCYESMFSACTGLATAPELPATTLASRCYMQMFSGCTGLTTAPALQVITLEESCYEDMFKQCSEFTAAPELPAMTLATSCYKGMFMECPKLTAAPELPAMTLVTSCYSQMFEGCTGLKTTPELNSDTMAEDCYMAMFSDCKKLTTAPTLPATTLATRCYANMFHNCTGLKTGPNLPATKLAQECYYCMFNGCTGLITAPALPATELADSCYYTMFASCTGLTTAPALLATTLAERCYEEMFALCTGLFITTNSNAEKSILFKTESLDQGTLNNCASGMFMGIIIDGQYGWTPIYPYTYYSDIFSGDEGGTSTDTTSYAYSSYSSKAKWQATTNNNWKYKKDNGQYAKDEWQKIFYNGAYRWYHFGPDTLMDTGWLLDKDGSWYYLNNENNLNVGIMQTGWLTDQYDGHLYYLDPVTGKMATGWTVIDGKRYYFNEVVPEASGWTQNESGDWVYEKRKIIPLGAMISR